MKGIIALLAVLAAFAGGGYYVYSHPADAQRAATWVQDEVHHLTAPSTSSPSSGVPLTPITDLPAPSPSAPPPPPWSGWSASDCTWAEQTLAWDQQLDEQEAQAVADGSDTRYGTGQWLIDYYRGYATEWGTVLAVVERACAPTPVAPTSAERSDALAWFAKATAAHAADAGQQTDTGWDPESIFDGASSGSAAAQWDQQWEARYARLAALFQT